MYNDVFHYLLLISGISIMLVAEKYFSSVIFGLFTISIYYNIFSIFVYFHFFKVSLIFAFYVNITSINTFFVIVLFLANNTSTWCKSCERLMLNRSALAIST